MKEYSDNVTWGHPTQRASSVTSFLQVMPMGIMIPTQEFTPPRTPIGKPDDADVIKFVKNKYYIKNTYSIEESLELVKFYVGMDDKFWTLHVCQYVRGHLDNIPKANMQTLRRAFNHIVDKRVRLSDTSLIPYLKETQIEV